MQTLIKHRTMPRLLGSTPFPAENDSSPLKLPLKNREQTPTRRRTMQRLIRIYSVSYEKTIKPIPIKVPDETLQTQIRRYKMQSMVRIYSVSSVKISISPGRKKITPSESDIKRKTLYDNNAYPD